MTYMTPCWTWLPIHVFRLRMNYLDRPVFWPALCEVTRICRCTSLLPGRPRTLFWNIRGAPRLVSQIYTQLVRGVLSVLNVPNVLNIFPASMANRDHARVHVRHPQVLPPLGQYSVRSQWDKFHPGRDWMRGEPPV